ncbi:head-tail connector protein [Paenibacillus senegalimassiliensis]|uniref:head-tail connector protein n=1 Tax=Paenibacillus senegalimassiliensis TaxID=1737426 RepID=UPI0009EAC0CE|nr:head-tail connector protein [Paenibacillus senegalimassiliensis]
MLEKLKLQLGIKLDDDAEDSLLTLMLEDAEQDVLTWTNRTEVPTSLESVVRQVVVIRYNKQGAEGQTSHSEGGISRSFEDLPKGLQQSILQKRLVRLVTYQ